MQVTILAHTAAHHEGKPNQFSWQSSIERCPGGSDIVMAQAHRVIIDNRRSGGKLNINGRDVLLRIRVKIVHRDALTGYILCKGKMLKDFKLHFAHEIDFASKTTQLALWRCALDRLSDIVKQTQVTHIFHNWLLFTIFAIM